jgi:uncharacterized protein (UPF0147 family)
VGKGHGAKMDRKQDEAIAALLTHATVYAAATAIGVAECTLRAWMRDELFRREYRAARRLVLEQATSRLQQISSSAANALKEVIEDSAAPHSARVAASKAVFELSQKSIELEDLAERIELLEQKSEGKV